MPGESVKDLVVRLSFEHGDTKSQITAIRNELKLMDSEFAAAAAQAAGFSGGLNQAGSAADQLRAKLQTQQQLVQKYDQAISEANEKLRKSVEAHQKQGQELDKAKAKREQLETEIDALKAAMEAEAKASGDNSDAYLQMDAQLDELNATLSETKTEIKNLEGQYARSDKAINRNEQAVVRLTTEQNNAKRAMAETSNALKQQTSFFAQASEKAAKYAESAKATGAAQQKVGRSLSKVSAAIVGAGIAAGKAAIDWESDFAGVRKTVNGTEEDLKGIEQALLDMEVPTDFSELAGIAANAGQLGIATENVVGFTRTMADLAETTDLTADEAATAFAQYANVTGMPQENIGRLGSVTVELGNNLATTESKITDFATAIASAGTQAGMSDQEIFGLAAGLSSLGLQAQGGGTAFSKAMIQMQVAVETGSSDLKEFAAIAGMTSEEFKASFGQDAAGTFVRFVQGLSSGSQSAIAMLDEMGIKETRERDMLLRASNASSLLTKAIGLANNAWSENVALTNEANVRYQTTASRMQMAGKQAQKVAMDFGKALMPAIEKGLDGIGAIVERFNALDETQRAGIVRWAAYVAAVGPAISVLGKANSALGGVIQGFSQLAGAVASGGGLSGLLSTLGGLLGPAGLAALAVGIGAAAYKWYDYASGAKAAREAQAALNKEAQAWLDTQANTIYDTGTSDPLARFGLTKDSFATSKDEAKSWMDELMTVWTDGKAETDAIVKQFADGFREGSDEVRGSIEGQQDLLSEYGALTPEAKANLDKDLKQLDDYDKEVADLLKKRQNGLLSEEDQARLNEIIEARAEIQLKYEINTDGYDQIVTQMEAEIERLRALGQEGGDPTLMGDTLNALADGRSAYMDALNQSYDAEYARIQTIDDEIARQEALNALNEKYNEQREQGEEAYASAVKEAAGTAWKEGGYQEQIDQLDELLGLLGDGENIDLPAISEMAEGLDEGKLASMISLVEQLKAAGASDEELKGLGIDTTDLYEKIDAIRDLTEGVEGLEDLNTMISEALPEEIQRIMVGLDMTQAAEDWAAFAEGKSIAPTITLEEVEASAIPVTGLLTVNGELGTVTGADGKEYRVTGATVNADGTLASVTAEDGKTYTVTDGDVLADGTLATVTGEDGKKYTVAGVSASVDGELGTVTGVDGKTYKVTGATVNADGTLASVTAEDGKTYTVDGANVLVNGTVVAGPNLTLPTFSTSVKLNPLDRAAITAWEKANSAVEITGPKAKIGVKLGANWATDLRDAYEAGLLAVYGEDGAPLDVTPEVVSQITANDIAMLDEDGTIHVIITPDVGSSEGLEQTDLGTTALDGTFLEPLSMDTTEKLRDLTELKQAMDEYAAAAERASKPENGMFDEETMMSLSEAKEAYAGIQEPYAQLMDTLTGEDLEAIGGRVANLMAALAGGEGSPEEMAAWQEELAGLMEFIDTIGEEDTTGTGENIMAGIAAGMQSYGWTGDANAVAAALHTAIDGAFGVASPATTMMPTGEYIAAGIGKGMTGYSFAGDASAVQAAIMAAYAGMDGKGSEIGNQFGAGLERGLKAKLPGIVAEARRAADQIAQAFREAWDVHSPSRVAENLTKMFGAGLLKGMENWPTVSERVLDSDLMRLRRGMGTVMTTNNDNRNLSTSNAINVENMNVRSDRDIEDVSRELYALTRRDQRLLGG